jgi:hypothetical protein
MKYYIYVSDKKVDMLAAQVPEKKLKSLAHQLELKVTLPWLPLSATYKPGNPMPSDAQRIERLRVIEQALDYNEVGNVVESHPWIKSSLNMSWGFIDTERRAVWFLGEVSGVTFVMGGSSKHLLGGVDVGQQSHHAYSLLPVLSAALIEREQAEIDNELSKSIQTSDVVNAARLLSNTAGGPRQRLSFLARRLMTESDDSGKVILASPLYVSCDEG